ncbi:DMT family transporter [Jiella pelagia]|uniref:DMT family transporter n=1 Tax=Jiella pelagia TaxID=2986949 RepID=A0ABY7BWS7_9HYPH|nr:DMT family transporter [Jiella pelagia]WAP67838.1 DMT family transporter [Jiella pelagia]
MVRRVWPTILAMIAFAGNSLLARLALADGAIDAASFTALRLLSGAAVLAVIVFAPRIAARSPRGRLSVGTAVAGAPSARLEGSLVATLALFAYALFFSLAYLRLGAAVGALILFASVQATMIATGLARGERPSARESAGLALAFGAFVWWLVPGLTRPDPLGLSMMVASGIAWGVYSLKGRGARDPLAATAGNFIYAVPLALPLLAASVLGIPELSGSVQTGQALGGAITLEGALIACLSGGVTSALGYIFWYRALAGLTALAAAIVQLSVPVIAAVGAVLFLGEPLTARFAIAGSLVILGIGLALVAKRR